MEKTLHLINQQKLQHKADNLKTDVRVIKKKISELHKKKAEVDQIYEGVGLSKKQSKLQNSYLKLKVEKEREEYIKIKQKKNSILST